MQHSSLQFRQVMFGTCALLLGVLLISVPSLLRADPSRRPTLSEHASTQANAYDPAHVLVELRTGVSIDELVEQPATLLLGNWYRVPINAAETAPEAVARLERHAAVLHVELDVLLSIEQTEPFITPPNDPFFEFQWNLNAIGAPQAWAQSTGAGVIVAVLDTGISQGPDLACHSFVAPYNVLSDTTGHAAVADDRGHGTHVAGTIAQCTNNADGVAGVAYGAALMPVKICDAAGSCSTSAIAAGINWATANGARVINMSLGARCAGVGDGNWPNCSSALVNAAIDAAAAADIVLVAASGNDNQSVVSFPANHPAVIAVGALDTNNTRTSYSTYGTALNLVAPGGDQAANSDGLDDGILQETLGRSCGSADTFALCSFQGTSMATPHVAGAVAILRSAAPFASRTAIQNALETSALDLGAPGFDPFYGNGLIQIPAALAALSNPVPTPTPTEPIPTPTEPIVLPDPTPTSGPGGTELPPALYVPFVQQ